MTVLTREELDCLLQPSLPEAERKELKSKTVLLADGDPKTLRMVSATLKEHGYHVFTARNGAECLSLLLRVRPHLVLLDVNMPGIDGFETSRRIRHNTAFARMSIAFLTATATVEAIERAAEAGADAFIAKPFKTSDLLERIELVTSEAFIANRIRAQYKAQLAHPALAKPASTARTGISVEPVKPSRDTVLISSERKSPNNDQVPKYVVQG
jgi:DNA-binding response OmpR family regulator